MFGALKRGRFRSLASLILVVNVVGKLQQKRTRASSFTSMYCGLSTSILQCLEISQSSLSIPLKKLDTSLPCLICHTLYVTHSCNKQITDVLGHCV